MLIYEITTRLDGNAADLYINKSDIAGTPTARLFNGALQAGVGSTFDEGTRWRIAFTSSDFNPVTADLTVRVTDGNFDVADYCVLNLGQSACVEGGVTLDKVIRVNGVTNEVAVGGFFRGGPETPSTTVQTSINGGSNFDLAPKIGTNPDSYQTVYSAPLTFSPVIKSNSCPENRSVRSVNLTVCEVSIDSISDSNPSGSGNATLTVTASGTGLIGALEYRIERIDNPSIFFGWQISSIFTNLDSGTYTVEVRDSGNVDCSDVGQHDIFNNLDAELAITHVTTVGGSDGSIMVGIISGSGIYSFQWLDGPTTQNRNNLIAGIYEVTIIDGVTGQQILLSGTVNQPNIIPPELPDPVFEVPKTQSLHFVIPETVDNCTVFETLDNTLLRNQRHYNIKRGKDYAQKKLQCDEFNIQFRSNLELHECQLRDFCTDEVVATYTPQLKIEYAGTTQDFNIRLQNNGSNQTRVYFIGLQALPLPLESGDNFEVFNNADGFNGIYAIVSIDVDAITSEQYIVINRDYDIVANSTVGEARFSNEVLTFNIWESFVSFATIVTGCYYMVIRAYRDDDSFDQTAISEPILIRANHKKTTLLRFTNVDNAYDIDYSTNIMHSVRVESRMFKRMPNANTDTQRNTDGSVSTLVSKPQRKLSFETYELPPYLHELISIAMKHDSIFANGMEIKTDESYGEPEYKDKSILSDSSVVVEQKRWFETYNGDDTEGLTIERGFILANNGFIKR